MALIVSGIEVYHFQVVVEGVHHRLPGYARRQRCYDCESRYRHCCGDVRRRRNENEMKRR